ncbi:hypothetical protein D6774_04160 [Candidatus Woesearchaeota archaeon]|nr:MAG: hypothetical protein D6774_04160 [Candidatus Woesearchaeota archaeon]
MTLYDVIRRVQEKLFCQGTMAFDDHGITFYAHNREEYARISLTEDGLEGMRIGEVPLGSSVQKMYYPWQPHDLLKRVSKELHLGETKVLLFLHTTSQGREIFSRLCEPSYVKQKEIPPYYP